MAAVVAETPGVVNVQASEDGLIVDIDPDQVTRYDLAAVIRNTLKPESDGSEHREPQDTCLGRRPDGN